MDTSTDRQVNPSGSRAGPLFAAALVVALGLLAHGRSLGSGFIVDDYPLVVQNPLVTETGHWRAIFTTDLFRNPDRGLLYRPVPIATFALNHALGALSPVGYHVTNIALHLVSALLVGLVALRLFPRPRLATLAAALFAVHPLLTESVGCVFARPELLSALGQLLALLAWLNGRTAASRARRLAFAAAMALAEAFALLSKESAVCLPGLILAEGLARRRPWREVAIWMLIPSAAIIAYLAWRIHLFGMVAQNPPRPEIFGLINPLASLPAWHRALAGLHLVTFAAGKFLWPATLSLDYSLDQLPTGVRPGLLLGAAAAFALFAATTREVLAGPPRCRWPDPLRLGLAWFLVTHLLVSNIVYPVSTIFAERLLHFPSAGLAIATAGAGDALWEALARRRRQALAAVLAGAVLLAAAARSHRRHGDLVSQRAAVLATWQASPDSAKALADAASVLMAEAIELSDLDRAAQARDLLRRSVEIWPGVAMHWFKLASAEAMLRDIPAARAAAGRALALPDADGRVHGETRRLLERLSPR